MADLIIKPSSGGSIKLQNNAGTDALTIDNSGNATLSGTANVYGEGTFPAGHVIGTEYMQYVAYKAYVNNTNWTTTGLTDTIVVKSQTSKILIQPKINIKSFSVTGAVYFRVDETATSLSEVLDDYWGNGTSSAQSGSAFYQYLHDHNQAAGTTLTYTINMRPNTAHANGIRVNDHYTTNTNKTTLVLMEIAQ